MLLVIDAGNTNVTLAVYRGAELISQWRLATIRERTADEFGVLARQMFDFTNLDYKEISGVVMASVVPPINFALTKMSEKYFGHTPLFVDNKTDSGLKILYEPASDVGADRIIAAVAAKHFYGSPCIVADFGTATTFDAINENGEYLGGVIAPGIGISSEALFQRAAKLPRVEIKQPASVIGTNTVGSMQSGLYFGYVGLTEGILRRMKGELGANTKIIATGGHAPLIAQSVDLIQEINDNLLLEGLRLIYERNLKQSDIKT